jgi:hypothetical protein
MIITTPDHEQECFGHARLRGEGQGDHQATES